MTELMRKLGIKTDSLVVAINANPDILAKIKEGLPDRTTLVTEIPVNAQAKVFLVWLTERDDLYQLFQQLRGAITLDGAIWAVIPKKKVAKKTTSVTFDQVQTVALKTDLVDNKVVSLSDGEYGIRFVVRKEKRGE